jgi:hypothetical protein
MNKHSYLSTLTPPLRLNLVRIDAKVVEEAVDYVGL